MKCFCFVSISVSVCYPTYIYLSNVRESEWVFARVRTCAYFAYFVSMCVCVCVHTHTFIFLCSKIYINTNWALVSHLTASLQVCSVVVFVYWILISVVRSLRSLGFALCFKWIGIECNRKKKKSKKKKPTWKITRECSAVEKRRTRCTGCGHWMYFIKHGHCWTIRELNEKEKAKGIP